MRHVSQIDNHSRPQYGVPDTNQQSVCGGESRSNVALYVAQRHPLATFAEGDGVGSGTLNMSAAYGRIVSAGNNRQREER